LRTIDKKYFSKNRGNIGSSFMNKRILSEIYIEEMDSVIYHIMSEVYKLYNSIINASADISLIFSPGIKRIEHLCDDELCFEDFHKEQFEEIFLKDDFLKVSIIINNN
jgi:hypothetical protein